MRRPTLESSRPVLEFPKCQGSLLKYANFLRGWQKRYFILDSGVLYYFSDYDTPNSRGCVSLSNAVVLSAANDRLRFHIDTGTQILHLRANTAAECERWIAHIKQHLELIHKLRLRQNPTASLTPQPNADPLGVSESVSLYARKTPAPPLLASTLSAPLLTTSTSATATATSATATSASASAVNWKSSSPQNDLGFHHWALPEAARMISIQRDVLERELNNLVFAIDRVNLVPDADSSLASPSHGSGSGSGSASASVQPSTKQGHVSPVSKNPSNDGSLVPPAQMEHIDLNASTTSALPHLQAGDTLSNPDTSQSPCHERGNILRNKGQIIVDQDYVDGVQEQLNRVSIAHRGLQESFVQSIEHFVQQEEAWKLRLRQAEEQISRLTAAMQKTPTAMQPDHSRLASQRVEQWVERMSLDEYSEFGTDTYYDAQEDVPVIGSYLDRNALDNSSTSESSDSRDDDLDFADAVTGSLMETNLRKPMPSPLPFESSTMAPKEQSTKQDNLQIKSNLTQSLDKHLGTSITTESENAKPSNMANSSKSGTHPQHNTIHDETLHVDNQDLHSFQSSDNLSLCTNNGLPFLQQTIHAYIPSDLPAEWKRRDRLPSDKPQFKDISLWAILKDAVGKDLSRITVPIAFCEPMTFLQRMCEDVEYSSLLDRATKTSDPYLSLAYITAFSISNYAATAGRFSKPLNPLLGETFEYIGHTQGLLFVAEQVSHHPPIGAAYCVSDKGWALHFDTPIKSKFWGKSMEIHPAGLYHFYTQKRKEHFSWNKVTTCIHNVMMGTRWLEHYGEVRVSNHTSGAYALLRFVKKGWFSGTCYDVVGEVYDAAGVARMELMGTWNQSMSCRPAQSQGEWMVIWEATPRPPHSVAQYSYTSYAMAMNEQDLLSLKRACPTDARFRPDSRALENGDIATASSEKHRLEEKQRATRRLREKNQLPPAVPKWFVYKHDDDSNTDGWVYKGGYWEAWTQATWPEDTPDIY
eukprot:TRINITY_DN4992_c0_g1_i1.p1 TRINITY_DN4992_c0_g1~~TRINITY_DN4992_c0_g1_i1.p1  ORF type:complete len:983 (+),score=217.14 TRINITY_DN4992_c0_g1_i1:36-2984(+)